MMVAAVSGIIVLVVAFAAGPYALVESETGTLTGCATSVNDASASGGQAVTLNNNCSSGQTASSISQYGITWTFSAARPVGQYANGDYWVLGPVTITSITPAASGGLNGWEVNPPLAGNSTTTSGLQFADEGATGGKQAFDKDGSYYSSSLMPTLPYTANGGQSLVKATSVSGRPAGDCSTSGCLNQAAILTVVDSVPPGDGATMFRPPFVGTSKPTFSTAALDAQLPNLPRLASTTSIDAVLPTLSAALAPMQAPDVGWSLEEYAGFHPRANVLPAGETNTYETGLVGLYTDAIFRALIAKSGDNETTRRQLLIALVQRGIDTYGEHAAGMHWYAAGGHNIGPRIMVAFAAWMLSDATIKSAVSNDNHTYDYADTATLQPNRVAGGHSLFGQLHCTHPEGDCETSYWWVIQNSVDNQNDPDPYGFIDGGYAPSTSYEQCCVASALVGEALAVHLIPGLDTVWADTSVPDFASRWKNHGLWAQPDPCAPVSQGGGKNPSRPGQCILDPDLTAGSTFASFSCQAGKQCGRYPGIDGESMTDSAGSTLAPGGGGSPGDWANTPLMRAMWGQYGP